MSYTEFLTRHRQFCSSLKLKTKTQHLTVFKIFFPQFNYKIQTGLSIESLKNSGVCQTAGSVGKGTSCQASGAEYSFLYSCTRVMRSSSVHE